MTMLDLDDLASFSTLLIVDLEATCSSDPAIPPGKMETIEIGAVVVETKQFQIVTEYQCFIRPVRNPVLTDFCTELTGISQAMVSDAGSFFEVFGAFEDWIGQSAATAAFCSWGAYDRRQLEQDCAMHGRPYTMPPHANLKELFSVRQNSKKRFGMARALQLCGVELAGQHHRALDDAKNIAQLLPWIVGERTIRL
ncbi:MAG: 3'-5' exonuclease [Pseudomonadota bacterium]